ncbi:asparagine synthase-related protein [uncultured Microbacterium sp.]|uniref:asparagine synthase-related protein n=1 Tax=uncultured Microbacterium sp. TaxID=191216 RepID=UPI00262FA5D7|nr:asparagine synthase-related protein [uncultured Microbacterium sp.]
MGRFRLLTDDERALGVPGAGRLTPHDAGQWPPHESPRQALEALIEECLPAGPCQILFSGGRDSSALLAVATFVARRVGADDPVPVTIRHPDSPESHEIEWQNLVVAHLKLSQHMVLEFRGEQSWLSSAATRSLTEFGLLWPASVHIYGPVFAELRRGSLMTGEGGDLVIEGRRITPLMDAVRVRSPREVAGRIKRLLGDRRRAHLERRELADFLTWLTPAGRELAMRGRIDLEPLRWNRALRHLTESRPAVFVHDNLAAMVATQGQRPLNPFAHPRFVAAVARDGGWFGRGARTALMRRFFGDVLSDEVLARRTKAAFNETRWLEPEREFARAWSGAGVPHEFIDVEKLRQEWLSERPRPLSELQLHAAWLAEHGLPLEPDGT